MNYNGEVTASNGSPRGDMVVSIKAPGVHQAVRCRLHYSMGSATVTGNQDICGKYIIPAVSAGSTDIFTVNLTNPTS